MGRDKDFRFEWYVLNYDHRLNKVAKFNIFDNVLVQEHAEKAVSEYLKSPDDYQVIKTSTVFHGFEALVEEIRGIIMWQEWGRCEYEIVASGVFVEDIHDIVHEMKRVEADGKSLDKYKEELYAREERRERGIKLDCFEQVEPNTEALTRELIYQYKASHKKQKGKSKTKKS